MVQQSFPAYQAADVHESAGVGMLELVAPVVRRWRSMVAVPVVVCGVAYALSFAMTPIFTATTVFMPPQQQQSAAVTALSSLGALTGLAGNAVRSPSEQYVSFMMSATVADRLIERFKLMDLYRQHFHDLARRALAKRTQISIGKKDGLITLSFDDTDPARAAAIANAYVEELRRMTSTLAVTEAQQRRVFFEGQLQATKAKLTAAQQALQDSGISAGTLKTEPKSAAEGYARLQALATAAEVRLQILRGQFADGANEVRQQQAAVQALHDQMRALEQADKPPAAGASPDYVSRYREFKYQEALFELMSRQYEAARVDESREGALIQVVDMATPPERKSHPVRSKLALTSAFFAAALYAVYLMGRERLRVARHGHVAADSRDILRDAG